jgi:hypothetical protein
MCRTCPGCYNLLLQQGGATYVASNHGVLPEKLVLIAALDHEKGIRVHLLDFQILKFERSVCDFALDAGHRAICFNLGFALSSSFSLFNERNNLMKLFPPLRVEREQLCGHAFGDATNRR